MSLTDQVLPAATHDAEPNGPESTSPCQSVYVDDSRQEGCDRSIIGGGNESPVALSKNAQKRLIKAQKRQEQKLERRTKEKAKRKENKRARALEIASGGQERPVKKPRLLPKPFDAHIVIDLDFDDLMSDKERWSLCSQLNYTYSYQRNSPTPFSSLVYSSFGGKTKEHMDSAHQGTYKRWKQVQWWEESYERIWSEPLDPRFKDADEAKSTVIYLTADSECEITALEPGMTYVIGGIVDHNRYKNLCLGKAERQGVRTAKLPIGTYLSELKTRKVLTVNQCYLILLKWNETRNWEESMRQVMPKRKFERRDRSVSQGVEEESGDEGDSVGVEDIEGDKSSSEKIDPVTGDDKQKANNGESNNNT